MRIISKIQAKLFFRQPENAYPLTTTQRKWIGFGSIVLGAFFCILPFIQGYGWQFLLVSAILSGAFFLNSAIFAFGIWLEKQRWHMLIFGIILAILGNLLLQIMPRN